MKELKYWINEHQQAYKVVALDTRQNIVAIMVEENGNQMVANVPLNLENLLIVVAEIKKEGEE